VRRDAIVDHSNAASMRTLGAVCAIVIWGCAGMRPALDRAGPDIATLADTHASRVRYLGEGCYSAERQIYSCSIDSLPAGERFCAREPGEQFEVATLYVGKWRHGRWDHGYYEPRLDSFVELLNTRRCHRRWYDTLRAAPAVIEIRDAPHRARASVFVPLAELGLVGLTTTITLGHNSTKEVCANGLQRGHTRSVVCVEPTGEVRHEPSMLFAGFAGIEVGPLPSVPGRDDLDAVFATATTASRPESRRCAVIDIDAPALRCTHY
jgi:hypothetical protein